MEAAFAIGMLLGGLLLGTWGAKKKKAQLICGGIVLLGFGLVGAGLLPPSGFMWFILFSSIMGLSGPLFGGSYMAFVQTVVEPAALGRVMSLIGTISLIATPIGLMIAGPMAEVLGVATWFGISGALIAIVGIGAYVIPSVRNLDELQHLNDETQA